MPRPRPRYTRPISKRRRTLLLAGMLVAMLLGVIGLGFLLAALLRAGLDRGAPLLTTLCLSGVMFTALCVAVVLLRLAARTVGEDSTAQRTITIGGFAILMSCAPLLMILVVYLLARGDAP